MFLSLSLSSVPSSIQPQDAEWGRTTLFKAAGQGHAEVVKLLIADGNAAVDKAANEGGTPLMMAAYEKHTEVVKLLITDGKAVVDQAANDGATPLYIAASKGNTEVVKLLVTEGADVNIANQGWTPLKIAKNRAINDLIAGPPHSDAAKDRLAIVALLEQ